MVKGVTLVILLDTMETGKFRATKPPKDEEYVDTTAEDLNGDDETEKAVTPSLCASSSSVAAKTALERLKFIVKYRPWTLACKSICLPARGQLPVIMMLFGERMWLSQVACRRVRVLTA